MGLWQKPSANFVVTFQSVDMEIRVADDTKVDPNDEVTLDLNRPASASPDQPLFAWPCIGCNNVLWLEVDGFDKALKEHGVRALAAEHDAPFELVGLCDADEKNQVLVMMCDECTEREIVGTIADGGTVGAPESAWGADASWKGDVGEA